MDKLLKVVLIALIFSAIVFISCTKKNNPPEIPSIPSGPSNGKIDTTYNFSSSATDPDGDSVAVRFDWGDGDTSIWSDFEPCGVSVSMSHSWSDAGSYSIKAQTEDLNEAFSSWSSGHQIVIGNPPNTPATPVGDSIGSINFPYSFISTATDPNGDSIAIRFDWGDGDTSDWSIWQASGDPITISHSWSDTGVYNIKAQAKDIKNETSDWSSGHQIVISGGSGSSWIKTFGGSGNDAGYSVDITSDGGYIITGSTDSYGAGETDVYIIKVNPLGNKQWDKTFGLPFEDYAYSVQQTSDGGYIIAGKTYSFGSLGQVYLIKTDSTGEEQWYKTKGYDDCDDWGNSVQQTSDGGYIIVGRTFDQGHEAIFLIKTDANGNNEPGWPKIKGYDDYDDICFSVQQTTDGGYIMVGYTMESGNGDVFLIKTDANGGGGWNRHIGGSSADRGYSVQQTTDGGYIITGWTRSSGAGESDVYLIKTDASGNQTWYKTFGGSNDDVGRSVQQTSDGGYIIAGYTYSFGAGSADVYLIKTDASGDTSWSKTFGGSDSDLGYSVQQTTDGGYIITGSKGGDVYLIKTDANGNVK
jgi:hypothetical protein